MPEQVELAAGSIVATVTLADTVADWVVLYYVCKHYSRITCNDQNLIVIWYFLVYFDPLHVMYDS